MDSDLSLSLTNKQRLVLTPVLRQALHLLQMSNIELSNYIEQQFQENPLLDLVEEQDKGETESFLTNFLHKNCDEMRDEPGEYFYDDFHIMDYLVKPVSLQEYLYGQLLINVKNSKEKLIGKYLLGNLDEHGYLSLSIEEVSRRLCCPPDEVERVLRLIQTFEPAGVGARSLSECLLLQLDHRGVSDQVIREIILNYLEDLAKGRLPKIALDLDLPVDRVQQAADLIKNLDPKPGRLFSSEQGRPVIIPDLLIDYIGGEFVVILNDYQVPKLRISPSYRRIMMKEGTDPCCRQFLEDKFKAACQLLKSIENRRNTIYKVVKAIIEVQHEFLRFGIKYLKPLKLQQVAEVVGIHESTVSRAIANKYAQTPQGMFLLKFFFPQACPGDDPNQLSVVNVKKQIKDLVGAEDKKRPLTDQMLTELLNATGLSLSRRTVAKYRASLGIPPASQRKGY